MSDLQQKEAANAFHRQVWLSELLFQTANGKMPVIIAGGGFALMAWELAKSRTFTPGNNSPTKREIADQFSRGYPSAEYYRILDNAWTGWRALEVARRINMLSDDPRVVL